VPIPAVLFALALAVVGFALAAFFPVEAARAIASPLRGRGGAPAVFWDMAASVARRRRVVRGVLVLLILALGGTCAAVLASARYAGALRLSEAGLLLVVLGLVAAAAGLARVRASGLGRPTLPVVGEPAMTARARRAVEGPAIAAGVPAPAVEVVGAVRPTLFTLPRQPRPLIVMTTGLLALLSPQELEAAAAHEIGHIATGEVEETQATEWLLDLVRVLGTAAVWLYVLTVPSLLRPLVLGLMLVCVVAAVRVLTDPIMEHAGRLSDRAIDGVIMLLNPPLVLANVLAKVFYFAIGRDEDLLADLRAVEFTRNPEALHAALRQVRDAPRTGPPLTIAHHVRYFTGEGVLPAGFPAAQAPIAARLALLERIDPGLRTAARGRPRSARCPDCEAPLAPVVVGSHYGAPIPVDRCQGCQGVWFDDLELYMTGAVELIESGAGGGDRKEPVGHLDCPRCGLALRRAAPFGMPEGIAIWECGTCGGAWVRPRDLRRFGEFRLARQRGRARLSGDDTVHVGPGGAG
jgi:Zn-dependent protease with chaperone function/Zn-finger nucleic acid-binding protein